MLALRFASTRWGGGGHILIPFSDDGEVIEQFRDLVRAHDPDHVVALRVSVTQWETWYPGSIQFEGVDDAARRDNLIENVAMPFPDQAAERARRTVASWCSPLRRGRAALDREAPELIRHVELDQDLAPRAGSLPPAAPPISSVVLAADEAWRSDWGLLAALRTGVRAAHAPSEEPGIELFSWLARPEQTAPPEGLKWSNSPSGPGPAEHAPDVDSKSTLWLDGQNLLPVSQGWVEEAGVIVVGDTASDYCLALAYDRLVGYGLWLTSAMLEEELFSRSIRFPLDRRISDFEHRATRVVVTSASVSLDALARTRERILTNEFEIRINGEVVDETHRRDNVRVGTPQLGRGRSSLVLDEFVGASVSIPFSTDSTGTREALTGLETPVPTKRLYRDSATQYPYWYVDVAQFSSGTPSGRDLPSEALLVSSGGFPEVSMRASRNGYTFDPRSMGFVPAGALMSSQIGRPRFRSLSMTAWIQAKAGASGFRVDISEAGRRAELIRRRLGDRVALLDLMTPDLLHFFRAFVPLAERQSPSDRDQNTLVLGVEPYLTHEAIAAQLPNHTLEDRLDLIDRLIEGGLLRRGLVLGCQECGRPSFITMDLLRHEYQCPQCGGANVLTSHRWRRRTFEPRWVYDLYATFREFLRHNGEIDLLAANALRTGARSYADAPQLQFFDAASNDPVAEVDLVACVNDELVVVEAKLRGSFGGRGKRLAQTDKLLKVASSIGADRLVLATSDPDWSETDLRHLEAAALRVRPFPIRVDTLVNLGTS